MDFPGLSAAIRKPCANRKEGRSLAGTRRFYVVKGSVVISRRHR
jgi:hypothetical protein